MPTAAHPPYSPVDRSLRRRLGVEILLLVLFSSAYFYQAGGHNANARFDQIRSLAESGSLAIDEHVYNTADVIEFGSSVYPNKAPGLSLLGAPFWNPFQKALTLLGVPSPQREELSCYLITVVLISFFTALLAAAVFYVSERMTGNATRSLCIALGLSLATIAFPFSTLFFSHQLAAALLFLCFSLVFMYRQAELTSPGWLLLAGFCAGYACTSEYPAALGAAALGLYALCTLPLRASLLCALGGVAGISCLLIYNQLAFGDIFFIPYAAYADKPDHLFATHRQGLMGVQLPSWQVILQITILPARGLFFCNPWLILLLPASILAFRSSNWLPEKLLAVGVVLLFFIFNAGFGDSIVFWGGGASVGPRHIIPMLPFAALLIGSALHFTWLRLLFYPLVLVSFGIMLMATAIDPQVPYGYPNPVVDLFFSNYLYSRFGLQHAGVFEVTPFANSFAAFNIGKLLDLPPALQLLPLLMVQYLWSKRLYRLACSVDEKDSPVISWQVLAAGIAVFALLPLGTTFVLGLRGVSGTGLLAGYYRGLHWPKPAATYQAKTVPPQHLLKRGVDTQLLQPFGGRTNQRLGPLSAEWRGYLRVDTPGAYVIAIESDDGSAVYLNGELLLDHWGEHGNTRIEKRINLTAGRHPIVVRYFNSRFGGSIALLWAPPNHALRPIPEDHLLISGPPRSLAYGR